MEKENIKPGMYVYTDDTFSAEPIADKQIKAVVGAIEKDSVIAVCLTEFWEPKIASGFLDIARCFAYDDGLRQTLSHIERFRKDGLIFYAGESCLEYCDHGVEKGTAFLPTIHDWRHIDENIAAVNNALHKIGAKKFRFDDCYLTTEFHYGNFEVRTPDNPLETSRHLYYQGRKIYQSFLCANNHGIWVRPVIRVKI